MVFDRPSHQIYFQDCKYRLISQLVVQSCCISAILATIWSQREESFIRGGTFITEYSESKNFCVVFTFANVAS